MAEDADLADNAEEKTIDVIKGKLEEGFSANVDPCSEHFTHHQKTCKQLTQISGITKLTGHGYRYVLSEIK